MFVSFEKKTFNYVGQQWGWWRLKLKIEHHYLFHVLISLPPIDPCNMAGSASKNFLVRLFYGYPGAREFPCSVKVYPAVFGNAENQSIATLA